MTEVFNIPELLELILQHLNYKQLFAVERVDSGFRSMLQTSKKLRRKMYLDPTAQPMPTLNPLLRGGTLTLPSRFVNSNFNCIINGTHHITCYLRRRFVAENAPEHGIGSWRDMRIMSSNATVMVTVDLGRAETGFQMTGDQTLGELGAVLERLFLPKLSTPPRRHFFFCTR